MLMKLGMRRNLAGLLAGDFHRVGLGLKPLAPLFPGPAVLRQEHGVTVGTAEGAAEVGITRPIETASLDEAGRWAEDGTNVDRFHAAPLLERS